MSEARVRPIRRTLIQKSDPFPLVLTAAQYAHDVLTFEGVPGGNFEVIVPHGAHFLVQNFTTSFAIVKYSGASGWMVGPNEQKWLPGTVPRCEKHDDCRQHHELGRACWVATRNATERHREEP